MFQFHVEVVFRVSWIMNIGNVDGKHSNPPYLHENHENTRKKKQNDRKYTFFSDRQDIENSFEV